MKWSEIEWNKILIAVNSNGIHLAGDGWWDSGETIIANYRCVRVITVLYANKTHCAIGICGRHSRRLWHKTVQVHVSKHQIYSVICNTDTTRKLLFNLIKWTFVQIKIRYRDWQLSKSKCNYTNCCNNEGNLVTSIHQYLLNWRLCAHHIPSKRFHLKICDIRTQTATTK